MWQTYLCSIIFFLLRWITVLKLIKHWLFNSVAASFWLVTTNHSPDILTGFWKCSCNFFSGILPLLVLHVNMETNAGSSSRKGQESYFGVISGLIYSKGELWKERTGDFYFTHCRFLTPTVNVVDSFEKCIMLYIASGTFPSHNFVLIWLQNELIQGCVWGVERMCD